MLSKSLLRKKKKKWKKSKSFVRKIVDEFVRYPLSQEEINQIRDGLKKKWDYFNRKFQNFAHITKIDTVGQKRR